MNWYRFDSSEPRTRLAAWLVALSILTSMWACDNPSKTRRGMTPPAAHNSNDRSAAQANATAASSGGDAASPDAGSNLISISDLESAELLGLKKPSLGDIDETGGLRVVRALVSYDRTTYFIDGARQRGTAYDGLTEFEKYIRTESPTRSVKVVIIPIGRDRLMKALADGYGEIAIGNLTITPEREKLVDFTEPVMQVKELVITGPTAPAISTLDDLSGKEVQVRAASSYRESLEALNQRFRSAGKEPVRITFADELLSDEDLVQMTDAGIMGITVIDQHVAKFWSQLYDRAKVREDLVLREEGNIAWAVRKNCPNLKNRLNEFIRTHRSGTLFGNLLLKRYFGSADRLKNPVEQDQLHRFRMLADNFRRFGDQYQLPWLLIAAQGYQESQLDQSRRSAAGAIGIMQIKRETAASVGIQDIEDTENNIHAGMKYMRFLIDQYFKSGPIDKLNRGLLAFAAYNAGPARVTRLRRRAEELGLNPNLWFNHVEIVAAREIGRETVDYVSNIYKYYTAYVAVARQRSARRKALAKQAQS